MVRLSGQQRVDWFRVFVDLERQGTRLAGVKQATGIPVSTLRGWRLEISRPRFEEGLAVLQLWADTCTRKLQQVPVIDPMRPHDHRPYPMDLAF